MAAKRPQVPPASAAPHKQVRVEIVYVERLPPRAEAAWQWFVTEVRARLARRREQIPPEDAA